MSSTAASMPLQSVKNFEGELNSKSYKHNHKHNHKPQPSPKPQPSSKPITTPPNSADFKPTKTSTACPCHKCNKSPEHDTIRNAWQIGSKIEVYSASQLKWTKGEITDIINDNEGEWLQVKYSGFRTKEIQRFSDYIRPITIPIKPMPNLKSKPKYTNKKQPMISTNEIRLKISDLITKYEPNNDIDINKLLKQYKNKEHELLYSLCVKYREKYSTILPKTLKNSYQIGPKIGIGGFAVVRKCKRRSDGQIFAMKVIEKTKYIDEKQLLLLENEIDTMRKLSHPNIVKLHDIFENEKKVCLILDLCEGKGIFDAIIENNNKGFKELDAKLIFYYLCLGLEYIHNKYIVHRDLKIQDLLFRKNGMKTPSSITLIDFGLCGSCEDGMLSDPVGTPNYVSPEVLRKEKYGTKADMWGIGVILYVMLGGYPPFYMKNMDDDNHKLYELIKQGKYEPMTGVEWYKVSLSAKNMVRKLLTVDVEKRLSATEALRHPWLVGVSLIAGYVRREMEDSELVSVFVEVVSRYY